MKKNGRPPMYDSPEELQKKIDEYFDSGYDIKKILLGPKDHKELVDMPVYTISGLVLYCGFCDRSAFYKYEEKKEFRHTIKRARERIAKEYEMMIAVGSGHPAGPIFALKNFGWSDKQIIELEDHKYLHVDFKDMTPEQLENEAKVVQNRIAGLIGSSGEN